jgi:hypothetical protein
MVSVHTFSKERKEKKNALSETYNQREQTQLVRLQIQQVKLLSGEFTWSSEE